jgi:cytochrome b pre-mRNA-processing protein 3
MSHNVLTHNTDCSLPPTFQSWFTITNLHIWLLTVRLRSLPKPAGQHHTQALIDHFFYDIEDRIRLVLRAHPSRGPSLPLSIPSSSPSSPTRPPSGDGSALEPFYTTPQGNLDANGKPIRQYAPERLVTQQMRVLKEQWSGLTLSLDLGLIRGDAELAGAIWRNFLGARGAKGIVLPWEGMTKEEDEAYYRRAVNAVGSDGEVKKVEKRGLEVEEKSEDYSGVSDYRPSEVPLCFKFKIKC